MTPVEAVITMEGTTILGHGWGHGGGELVVTATACPPEATTAEFFPEMSCHRLFQLPGA